MSQHTAQKLSERLFGQALTTLEAGTVWIGHQLGWYAALHSGGPATPDELATRTGTQPRYAREWCEQQAVAGILGTGADGRFVLPEGHAEALLDEDSPAWTEPLVRQIVTAVLQLPAIAQSFRNGGGVSWEQFGPDMSKAQGDVNRPLLRHTLAREWVPQVPGLAERLDGGAKVVDVGCGHGWSAVGLATTFPRIQVDGFDVDTAALAAARKHAADAGVADRVRFHQVDAASGIDGGPYDVLTIFECVHDLARPVEVLSGMRKVAAPDAIAIVVDEAADPVFAAPGDEIQRLIYGFSLLICLPDSLSQPDSVGTGAVMRPSVLDGYAKRAGFTGAQPLEVSDTGFWRFYRLGL